jgi:hypothetical protein
MQCFETALDTSVSMYILMLLLLLSMFYVFYVTKISLCQQDMRNKMLAHENQKGSYT